MFEREKVALEQQLQEFGDDKEALTRQYQKLAQAHGTLRDTAGAAIKNYRAKYREHVASLAECDSQNQALNDKVRELEAALTLANTKAEMLETLKQKSQKIEDEKEALTIKNQKLMQLYSSLRDTAAASNERYNAMIDQRHREHVASLAECESHIQAFADKVRELEEALNLANTKA